MCSKRAGKDWYTHNIGVVLRTLREHRNWSQEGVAQSLGDLIGRDNVCQSTIYRIETGQHIITVERLVLLAKIFNVCPQKILAKVVSCEHGSIRLSHQDICELLDSNIQNFDK